MTWEMTSRRLIKKINYRKNTFLSKCNLSEVASINSMFLCLKVLLKPILKRLSHQAHVVTSGTWCKPSSITSGRSIAPALLTKLITSIKNFRFGTCLHSFFQVWFWSPASLRIDIIPTCGTKRQDLLLMLPEERKLYCSCLDRKMVVEEFVILGKNQVSLVSHMKNT